MKTALKHDKTVIADTKDGVALYGILTEWVYLKQFRRRILTGALISFLLLICYAVSSCVHCTDTGWREYKVFCGMSSKGGEVTEADWRQFCDEHVTTAFPDGYTSFEATGYWKGRAATTERENSRVLIIVAPAEAKSKVLTIAKQYREQFQQEAVLVMTSKGEAIFVEEGQ